MKFENPGNPVEITEEGKDKVSFQYNAAMGRSNMFYGGLETDKLQVGIENITPMMAVWRSLMTNKATKPLL